MSSLPDSASLEQSIADDRRDSFEADNFISAEELEMLAKREQPPTAEELEAEFHRQCVAGKAEFLPLGSPVIVKPTARHHCNGRGLYRGINTLTSMASVEFEQLKLNHWGAPIVVGTYTADFHLTELEPVPQRITRGVRQINLAAFTAPLHCDIKGLKLNVTA